MASKADTSPPYAAERTSDISSSVLESDDDVDVNVIVEVDDVVVVVVDAVAGVVTSEKEVATARPKA